MYFVEKQEFPYTKSMFKAMIPEIIKNSKTLQPYQITPFAGIYVFFLPKSKIIWNSDSVVLENFFFSRYEDFHDVGSVIYQTDLGIRKYPSHGIKSIYIHTKELLYNNFDIKIKPVKNIKIGNVRTNNLQSVDIGDTFEEHGQTKILVSAYEFNVFRKTKKEMKNKVNIIMKHTYNVAANSKEGSDLESYFSETTTDTFQIVDNYTETLK